jgi:hypothetical protein
LRVGVVVLLGNRLLLPVVVKGRKNKITIFNVAYAPPKVERYAAAEWNLAFFIISKINRFPYSIYQSRNVFAPGESKIRQLAYQTISGPMFRTLLA